MSILGSKTKRVLTYGRRGHRIVITDEKVADIPPSPSFSLSNRENTSPEVHSKAKPRPRVRPVTSLDNHISPKVAFTPGNKAKKYTTRHPLALYEPNTPGSPAQLPRVKKRTKTQTDKPLSLVRKKPSSPPIELDIIVIDDNGRKLSQERRVSRTDVQVNLLTTSPPPAKPTARRARKNAHQSPVLISLDTEDELVLPRSKVLKKKRAIVISSDESDTPEVNPSVNPPVVRYTVLPLPTPTIGFHRQSTHIPPSSPPIHNYRGTHVRSKPRQLTPIRRGKSTFPRPPSPSTDSDVDGILDLADISISTAVEEDLPPPPAHLIPLLRECRQDTPHEFSAFIETFPFDPIVHSFDQGTSSMVEFRKIGEASYSEVFGIGNVVLKIIPLRDEENIGSSLLDTDKDSPPPSDAKDVLKEINVTRSMGEICNGFIKLLRAYVVRGKYPSLLLSSWDEFHASKGSESIKPDTFPVSQTYAIIVLPNGGPDLEAYTFTPGSKKRWSQASSIFWQVVRTLGNAENLVAFEHRDLHWGQILVQNIQLPPKPRRKTTTKTSMDDAVHGVAVTIIDLGLARMDESHTITHWTPFEPEIFEGEGDYQFEIYRLMKGHNGDSWSQYRPLTNVMWLHYLLQKLLSAKNLKPPAAPRKTAMVPTRKTATFTERECYLGLVQLEVLLGAVVERNRSTKSRTGQKKRRTPAAVAGVESADLGHLAGQFTCAGDVLKYGIRMDWISESQ